LEGLERVTTPPGPPGGTVEGRRCLVCNDGGGVGATTGIGLEVGGGVKGLTGLGGVGVEGGTAGLGCFGFGGVTAETGTTGVAGLTTARLGDGVAATWVFGAVDAVVVPGALGRNGLAGVGRGVGAAALGCTVGVGAAKGTPRGGATITCEGAITLVLPNAPLPTSSTAAAPASAARRTVAAATRENLPSLEPEMANGRKRRAALNPVGGAGSALPPAPAGPVNRAKVCRTDIVSHWPNSSGELNSLGARPWRSTRTCCATSAAMTRSSTRSPARASTQGRSRRTASSALPPAESDSKAAGSGEFNGRPASLAVAARTFLRPNVPSARSRPQGRPAINQESVISCSKMCNHPVDAASQLLDVPRLDGRE
jgi:hypothetical protein